MENAFEKVSKRNKEVSSSLSIAILDLLYHSSSGPFEYHILYFYQFALQSHKYSIYEYVNALWEK